MAMPPEDTKVTNVLEGANYLVGQKRSLSKDNIERAGEVVLSGTVKEQWVTDLAHLNKQYTLCGGSDINESYFAKDLRVSHVPGWVKIQTKPHGNTYDCYALFLPINEIRNFPVKASWATLYANRDGIDHGKGDFLVCSKKDGKPDFSDVWVVNGNVFLTTYVTGNLPNDLKDYLGIDKSKKDDDDWFEAPTPINTYSYWRDVKKPTYDRPIDSLADYLKKGGIPVVSITHDVDAPMNSEQLASQIGISLTPNTLEGKVDVWTINFTDDEMSRVTVLIDEKDTFTVSMVLDGSEVGLYKNLNLKNASAAIRSRLQMLKEQNKVQALKDAPTFVVPDQGTPNTKTSTPDDKPKSTKSLIKGWFNRK
jgi:hypothetical protein